MKHKAFIGVDFGGTKIMTGAIDSNGKIINSPIKVLTESKKQPDVILKKISDSIHKIIDEIDSNEYEIIGIGLGVSGPLDIENGIILDCPQLPTMQFYPLKEKIEESFPLPVFMNNDANCLIYGETIFGASKNNNNVVGFTLGTGLGCAIVLNMKLFNGSTGSSGEIWISPYADGIIEDFVSGDGVSKIYNSISGENKSSIEIFNFAQEGNPQALQTWKEFGEHLAFPIAWSINFIDPQIIILGGSIVKAYDFFINSLEEKLKKNICRVPSERIKIVKAELGDFSGFIGAACLVMASNLI